MTARRGGGRCRSGGIRLAVLLLLLPWCGFVATSDATASEDLGEEEARVLQLARRASFGPTPQLLAEVRRLGRDGWIARQIAPQAIADPGLEARLRVYPALAMDSSELLRSYPPRAAMAAPGTARPLRILAEVSAELVVRAVHAEAQLAEVMTDFWLNHFNVYAAEGPTRYSVVAYVRDAIRPHALGRFRDLLRATAESPAMLHYLNNYLSTAPSARRGRGGLNENYARELLELHTLGVEGGYTQSDVTEVARIFTGWTITPLKSGLVEHVFAPGRHDRGTKTVLGHVFAPAGKDEGLALLDVLATAPATAEHVARKLASRFVADVPPESVVARARDAFLASGGDIGEVVAAILRSEDFYATANRGTKVKSPLELMASALRATGAEVRIGADAARLVGAMGQPILRAEPPTGWDETADALVSAGGMVTRFDVAALIASDEVQGVRVDRGQWTALAESPPGLDALARHLLQAPASTATRAALERARAAGAPPTLLAALVLSSPEFQLQ